MMASRCPWYIAGPLLGLLIVGLRAAVNKPLGALGGYIDIVDGATRSKRPGFSAFLLGGVVAGSALHAVLAGSFSLTWSYPGAMDLVPAYAGSPFVVLAAAGLAMGIGARTAGGCTSGHGLSGVSMGSPASLVATMTFFATAVALANAVVWLAGGQP